MRQLSLNSYTERTSYGRFRLPAVVAHVER